jgi:hypothetical protein
MTGPRGRGVMCNAGARPQGPSAGSRRLSQGSLRAGWLQRGLDGPEGRPLESLGLPQISRTREVVFRRYRGARLAAQGALHETDCNQKLLNCQQKRTLAAQVLGAGVRTEAQCVRARCLSVSVSRRDPALLSFPDSTSETLEPTPPAPLSASWWWWWWWWFAALDVIVVLWPAPLVAHTLQRPGSAATVTAGWLSRCLVCTTT